MSRPCSTAGPHSTPDPGPCGSAPRLPALSGIVLAGVALISVGLRTRFDAPPRFDGAGYAVLAEALRSGRGYRAIDRPDAPRHAHFPPGYPTALAALWAVTGPSVQAAHALSVGCTVVAVLLFAVWLRGRSGARAGQLLALALALNWSWGRLGGAIQSEPLFFLFSAALLVARDGAPRLGPAGGVGLGALAAACVLTRHVGLMLAMAVALDLAWSRQLRLVGAYLAAMGLGLLPWLLWLLTVREGTQAGLLPRQGLPELVASQAAFYALRIPDVVAGPFVEVATVFRPSWQVPGLAWSALATGTVLLGLGYSLFTPRFRLAGLAAGLTMALLLVWPFQEAGRFLVPLVPLLLLGAAMAPLRPPTGLAAGTLLALSLPYNLYDLAAHRSEDAAKTLGRLDAACRWIVAQGQRPGSVLCRQGAEAYWLLDRTRTVVPVPGADSGETVAAVVRRFGVAYLIDDADRYARSEPSPVAQFAAESPNALRRVWQEGPITVYQVRDQVSESPD